uniref:Uncharacterized protein n=1 Tax=Solanum tuberosum TaxID=4113 RepID=M1DEZ2_SOLTU
MHRGEIMYRKDIMYREENPCIARGRIMHSKRKGHALQEKEVVIAEKNSYIAGKNVMYRGGKIHASRERSHALQEKDSRIARKKIPCIAGKSPSATVFRETSPIFFLKKHYPYVSQKRKIMHREKINIGCIIFICKNNIKRTINNDIKRTINILHSPILLLRRQKKKYIEDYTTNTKYKLYLLHVKPDRVYVKYSRRTIKCQHESYRRCGNRYLRARRSSRCFDKGGLSSHLTSV